MYISFALMQFKLNCIKVVWKKRRNKNEKSEKVT